MNTEALNTLKQIREGINVLQTELNDPTLTPQEKGLLADTIINLNRMDDIIINNILHDLITKINSSNAELKNLISRMEASSEKIAQFSNTIKRISDAVGVLAEITAKAISVGIL